VQQLVSFLSTNTEHHVVPVQQLSYLLLGRLLRVRPQNVSTISMTFGITV